MVLTWGLLVWIEVSRPLSQWFSGLAAQNYLKSHKNPSTQTASETNYIRASEVSISGFWVVVLELPGTTVNAKAKNLRCA